MLKKVDSPGSLNLLMVVREAKDQACDIGSVKTNKWENCSGCSVVGNGADHTVPQAEKI
ncbi:hypothetical protein HDG70_000373 [Carboxydothermus ferrireducens DSM 11255]|uniref:Uncharacterized protein n=1 Tax=Carboxydothermus ferrireducens DSM 11255 TaxID=1119529 RepID=A0ABX2R9Y5_9THEO|nr:hypothetical protein [Carboxydothermus ferrireducens DSM 11255]